MKNEHIIVEKLLRKKIRQLLSEGFSAFDVNHAIITLENPRALEPISSPTKLKEYIYSTVEPIVDFLISIAKIIKSLDDKAEFDEFKTYNAKINRFLNAYCFKTFAALYNQLVNDKKVIQHLDLNNLLKRSIQNVNVFQVRKSVNVDIVADEIYNGFISHIKWPDK